MSDPKQARILLEAAERDFFALRGMDDAGAAPLDRDAALRRMRAPVCR